MPRPDLNLLVTLDAVLREGNVARAARRLKLSPSAMSRALSRLREATGDPLLVRAGRSLVPTPRAAELRERVGQTLQDAEALLQPGPSLDLPRLVRTFTLRASEGLVETFGPALIARVAAAAPGVRLRFLQKVDKDSAPLREGAVDLETGVLDQAAGPELRVQMLFRDRFVGAVRTGHALAKGRVTTARYIEADHVCVSRQGTTQGPIDQALAAIGQRRNIATIVAGFATAVALARGTDLVATVPERHTGALLAGMHCFALPFESPIIAVSLFWHPRLDADPAHRWLRQCVREVCSSQP
jgi:DNA-binding transcriptional LysR family regulator